VLVLRFESPGQRSCEKIATLSPAVRKGSALPDRRLKIKLFGLSRLPESRRLSPETPSGRGAQQAAQPHRPVANDFFTPAFAMGWSFYIWTRGGAAVDTALSEGRGYGEAGGEG